MQMGWVCCLKLLDLKKITYFVNPAKHCEINKQLESVSREKSCGHYWVSSAVLLPERQNVGYFMETSPQKPVSIHSERLCVLITLWLKYEPRQKIDTVLSRERGRSFTLIDPMI